MGCGASVSKPKEATKDQKITLCKNMGSQMMLLCVPKMMARRDEITVTAPPDVAKLREVTTSLREQAARARAKESSPEAAADVPAAAEAAATEEAAAEPEKKGGILGSMVAAVGGTVSKGLEAADKVIGKAAGCVMANALEMVAELLDKAVDAVEKPMTSVGKEIVEKKSEEIARVFEARIANLKFAEDAVMLVRGAEPHGGAEYQAVPEGALSKYLMSQAEGNIAAQLKPVVEEELRKHAAVKSWQSVIEQYNKCGEKCEEYKLTKLSAIELDIHDHIVQQTVDALTKIMGEEEAALRRDSAGTTSKYCNTFAKVFSGEPLFEETFAIYEKEKAEVAAQ